jgi:tetraacyldisaccharide 4'-kinase
VTPLRIPFAGPLGRVHGRLARWRRRWYALHPEAVRELWRPVVSVGNLAVGGAGKTPFTAFVCRALLQLGERPAILTRGYGRRRMPDGVVTARDAAGRLVALDVAGDEPLMLARALPDVPVLISPDRYLAGRLAEVHFGATVHVLDDGFQHLGLKRDVDVLLIDPADVTERVLPAGRLREPIESAAAAHAVVVVTDRDEVAAATARELGVDCWFRAVRRAGTARDLERGAPVEPAGGAVVAVAGIARPERFVDDLRSGGWTIAAELRYRDHHPYTREDMDRVERAAAQAGATLVVTTDKDAERLRPFLPIGVRVAAVPLTVEPAAEGFVAWLRARLAGVPATAAVGPPVLS